MEMGIFTTKNNQPSRRDIRFALGPTYSLWDRLTLFIETIYLITGVFSTWGPKEYGWGLRYKRKGRALVALYPQKCGFIAQVVLGKAQAERALELEFGEKVSKDIEGDAPTS